MYGRDVFIHFFLMHTFSLKVSGSDLLPPLHIFILSLLCKAFKYVLSSRTDSATIHVHKYVFNVYLGESDVGLPLSYFLFLSLSTSHKKHDYFLSLVSSCLPCILNIVWLCFSLFPSFSPLLIFFLTFLHFSPQQSLSL